jgi:hypothetical protein
LSLDVEDSIALIEGYERDTKAMKDEALRMCWYMRGSISYNDAMLLSQQERNIIDSIIKDNMKTTKDSGLPFF